MAKVNQTLIQGKVLRIIPQSEGIVLLDGFQKLVLESMASQGGSIA